MKKIKFGKVFLFLSVLVVGAVAIIGTSLVKAADDEPDMKISISVDDKREVDLMEGNEFEVEVAIDPGQIKFIDATTPNVIQGATISLDSKDFSILASDTGTLKDNIVALKQIDYRYDGVAYNKAEPFVVKLKVKALKVGEYKKEKSFNKLFKLNYKNISGDDVTPKVDSEDGKIDLTVSKVVFADPAIVPGENPPAEVNFGGIVKLNYTLKPVEITVDKGQARGEKKVIYIADESVLNKDSEDGENIKNALTSSLSELKGSNLKENFALITYGSEAKVIKSGDKSFYGVDELIKNINAVEGKQNNGNLGDALRQAQSLINENKDASITIILVTEGEPAYYPANAERKPLTEFSLKAAEEGTGFEESKNYVDDLVKRIKEENEKNKREVTWLNINTDKNDNSVDKAVKALGGETVKNEKPTALDFSSINKSASADFIVKGVVAATGGEKVKVAPESEKQNVDIFYNYKRNEKGDIETNSAGQKILEPVEEHKEIAFNVGTKFLSATEMDLADPENLKVAFSSGIKDEKDVIFNTTGDTRVQWNVKPIIGFLKNTGLHNGKLENFSVSREINVDKETLKIMSMLGSQIFDGLNAGSFNLSKDNTFRTGSLLKVNTNMGISPTCSAIEDKNSAAKVEKIDSKIYKFDSKTNKFIFVSDMKYGGSYELFDTELYLVVTDCTISDSSVIDSEFDIGYELTVKEGSKLPNGASYDGEDLSTQYFVENQKERTGESKVAEVSAGSISTRIRVKDKPKHY